MVFVEGNPLSSWGLPTPETKIILRAGIFVPRKEVMNKSHLLINEQALQVLPSLAVQIGLNEAIALQQIHYWLNNQKNTGRVDEEGNKWVYNTYAQWREDNFPFWSEDKIQRIFLSLEKQGVLIARQLDAKSRDMTKFYRIDYDQLCAMDDAILRPSNTANLHDVKMNQRLPENNLPLDWKIQAGQEITEDDVAREKAKQEAPIMFEEAFGFGKLPWSSNKTWTDFEKFVIKLYTENPQVFLDYVKWREGEGKYKAYTNKKIREMPQMFMDTGYPEFCARIMYQQRNDRSRGL